MVLLDLQPMPQVPLKTCTKLHLATKIAKESGFSVAVTMEVVQRFLDNVTQTLGKGLAVELRDFGVFKVKRYEARSGRNPRNPEEEIPIPARNAVKFTMGRKMKKLVLEGKVNS